MTYYLLSSLFLFFFTSFAYACDNRAQIKITFVVVTFFAIFCGLRWYSGNDYGAYIDIFQLVPKISGFNLTDVSHIHSEIGYKFINSILKTISLESYSTIFVIALVSLYLKFFFYFKLVKNVFFCTCFYLALHFFRAEFIQVRMALGLGVLCVGLIFFFKGDKLKFFVAVILATTIHSICIILLILLITRDYKLRYLLFWALALPLVFSFFLY